MQLTPTTAAATPATQTAVKSEPKSTGAMSAGSDFQTFLTLLTAQMRNQDPLKPMDSTEFVAQLASFSSVEQQVRTNDQLEQIFTAMSGGSSAGIAQWIGREVRAPAAANFQGIPVEVEIDPASGADSATLVVRNAFDQVVARRAIEPDATLAIWDGQNAVGETQPNGSYRFEIESYAGETLLGTAKGRVFSPVTEVQIVNGVPNLVLEGGDSIAVDSVTAVR
jgi:flagellar basal-body rod modification protein FlgD